MRRRLSGALVLAGLALSAAASLRPLRASAAHARVAVAIIVNAANQAPDPTTEDLRGMLTLERQFWPNGRRIVLFLPPSGSPAKEVLLERVYGMSDFELRKFWVGKLFRGAIPSIPSSLQNVDAAISAVRATEGGMAAVLATEVPPTVRVLRIDGKQPNDPAYPLIVSEHP